MWWKYLTGILIATGTVAVFILPPPQAQIGAGSRIFFYHVPAALIGFVAFIVSAVYGAIYLKNRNLTTDRKAAAAAEIGLTFTIIATLSGAIFSRVTWGAFWNWDPRQTSILAILLIYGAYTALRQAVPARATRARLSAVYLLLAGFIAPLLFFIFPRIYPSLHPNDSLVSGGGEFAMTLPVGLTFAVMLAGYGLLYLWLFQLAHRTERIKDNSEE
ncbi:cytochrome c biogenesis protein CcsA [Candidatus Zixiibacteriota bacterium]